MSFLDRFFKIYKDKDGWSKVNSPEIEHLNSAIYFDYKRFSDLAEYASGKNFESKLKEASHALSCIIAYRNMYQLRINERGEEDATTVANIFIVCRFANSIYATMRLACMGLILDGVACFRTAFEALQYGRLISLKPELASTFMDVEGSLRPVEVRKELERLGHNVDLARKQYSMLSTFSHVGGLGETLTTEDIGGNVAFKIGGYLDPPLQKRLITDCHKACGEFIGFTIGIRHENIDRYHQTIKTWIAEGLAQEEILQRIQTLI